MSTAVVMERIRAARAERTPLRIHGSGTWLDAGRPVEAPDTLSVADDRGIVEYVPGDLTMTARAGSTMAELDAAARAHGQWLPLAPWGSERSTLGATISTATAGPYAAAFGLPRDVVLGLEFVTGIGDVVRSGGRVVKNVAGFDLTRLLTGSWGTLGVITEATVRLRALPEVTRTVLLVIEDGDVVPFNALCSQVRALPFAPFACELVSAELAARSGIGSRTTLVVELGGNRTSVAAQLDLLRGLGACEDAPPGVIARIRGANARRSWRVSALPARFATVWAASAGAGIFAHGSMIRGVVRVLSDHAAPSAPAGATLTVERLPVEDWRAAPATARNPLEATVRAKFDPDRILNPGILGGAA